MNNQKTYVKAVTVLAAAILVPLLQGCSRSEQAQNSSVPIGNPSTRPKMEDMRYGMQLMGLFDGIRQLEAKGQNKLSSVQARDLAANITAARTGETFTETNAKDSIRSVQLILTEKQRNEISSMIPERGFRKGHQGGPGGPPPGGAAPQGGAPGGPQGGPGTGGNLMQSPPVDELLAILEKRAVGS